VEPFRNEIAAARERAKRAEIERDELLREAADLRARLASIAAEKRPPRPKAAMVVFAIVTFALFGWVVARILVPRSWLDPSPEDAEPNGRVIGWTASGAER